MSSKRKADDSGYQTRAKFASPTKKVTFNPATSSRLRSGLWERIGEAAEGHPTPDPTPHSGKIVDLIGHGGPGTDGDTTDPDSPSSGPATPEGEHPDQDSDSTDDEELHQSPDATEHDKPGQDVDATASEQLRREEQDAASHSGGGAGPAPATQGTAAGAGGAPAGAAPPTRRIAPVTRPGRVLQTTSSAVIELPFPDVEELAHDEYVMKQLRVVRLTVRKVCKDHLDFKLSRLSARTKIKEFMKDASYELIRHAACIATGGPQGKAGWEELLIDPVYRRALVQGIINRALKEHVLSSLAFGAPQKLLMELREMEKQQINRDGFYRASMRATHIKAIYGDNAHEKWDQDEAAVRIALQLEWMLQPLLQLNPLPILPDRETVLSTFAAGLLPAVKGAAVLNGFIRQYGAAVYFFQPAFKDDEFDPDEMECLNLPEMQHTCPYPDGDKPAANPNGDKMHKSLVRVVGSDGLVAYRKGGGVAADVFLKAEEAAKQTEAAAAKRPLRRPMPDERVYTAEDGVRTRILSKAEVALYWGKWENPAKRTERKSLLEVWEEA